MRAYFDKENIISFIKAGTVNGEGYYDCNRMFRTNVQVRLNFTAEDIFNQLELFQPWLNTFTDGVQSNNSLFPKTATKKEDYFPQIRPLDSNLDNVYDYLDNELRSSVFLLDDIADKKVKELKEKGNLIVGLRGEEINTLLSTILPDYQYSDTLEANTFNQELWGKLRDYVKPCSDIIISDQFILSNPRKLEQNLYALLDTLCLKLKLSQINIVIFCLATYKKRDISVMNNWEQISTKIKSKINLNRFIKKEKISVTFVGLTPIDDLSKDKKKKGKSLKEHDRTIFTNYMLLVPGTSLNFYNEKKELDTNGRYFHLLSLAKQDYQQIANRYINDMQAIIYGIMKDAELGIIYGDLRSNLLIFE